MSRGEAELGIVITTDIVADAGVELVAPLPAELQSYVTFTAAVNQQVCIARAAVPTAHLLEWVVDDEQLLLSRIVARLSCFSVWWDGDHRRIATDVETSPC